MPGAVHAIDVIRMGTAPLPESELPLLQRVLRNLAVQTQGFLFSPDITLSYPAVHMFGLSASL